MTRDYLVGTRVLRQTPVVTRDRRFLFVTPTDYSCRARRLTGKAPMTACTSRVKAFPRRVYRAAALPR